MAEMTHKQLKAAVAELAKEVMRSAEAIRSRAQAIQDEANDTSRVAEAIATLSVDTSTVAEGRELAKLLGHLEAAAVAYASAGDTTEKAASAALQQAKSSHDGINEAVNRSGVQGIHKVDRTWFTQE